MRSTQYPVWCGGNRCCDGSDDAAKGIGISTELYERAAVNTRLTPGQFLVVELLVHHVPLSTPFRDPARVGI